jgi:hypothetical protein
MKPSYGRQAICPGPNIAWFDRSYSLDEMVNHIYRRTKSLVPVERPHMFAKEMQMYVDYLEELVEQTDPEDPGMKKIEKIRKNLLKGMEVCLEIAGKTPYPGENLDSLRDAVFVQRERLNSIFAVAV